MSAIRSKNNGLTLIELLVVITVASVLAVVALPDLAGFIKNNRSAADINDLLSSLTFARSEAVKRNSSVAVCLSANGSSCQAGDEWQNGWIVFEDRDLDQTVDDPSEILSIHGGLAPNRELTFDSGTVTYRSDGLATTGTNGTFALCDDRGAAHAKGLIIGASGRPRLAMDADESGVVEDAEGDDLECGS